LHIVEGLLFLDMNKRRSVSRARSSCSFEAFRSYACIAHCDSVRQQSALQDVAYALNCPDGRKVFLEKTRENAVLSLTDSQGHSIKTLACEF
uniref:Zeta-sarcoglycan n=1 Tax=Heligmosomoides polygyrus TaxID=6339 RepID=A0A183GNJ8_HELPZ